MAEELKSSKLDLIAQLRAPCGDSVMLLTTEGSSDKFDPLRLAAAREIEKVTVDRDRLLADKRRLHADVQRLHGRPPCVCVDCSPAPEPRDG